MLIEGNSDGDIAFEEACSFLFAGSVLLKKAKDNVKLLFLRFAMVLCNMKAGATMRWKGWLTVVPKNASPMSMCKMTFAKEFTKNGVIRTKTHSLLQMMVSTMSERSARVALATACKQYLKTSGHLTATSEELDRLIAENAPKPGTLGAEANGKYHWPQQPYLRALRVRNEGLYIGLCHIPSDSFYVHRE